MKNIAIVGAGAAGLVAAKTLLDIAKEKGVSLTVTLFEASDKIGGRTQSHEITNEWNLDLGAQYI